MKKILERVRLAAEAHEWWLRWAFRAAVLWFAMGISDQLNEISGDVSGIQRVTDEIHDLIDRIETSVMDIEARLR